MDVTKPYEFVGFGAMDGPKPYDFRGFWVTVIVHAGGVTRPMLKFRASGAV